MMRMDAAIQAVLDSYEARYGKESQLMRSEPLEKVMARRDEFLLPVGAETGTILNLLSKGAQATSSCSSICGRTCTCPAWI